MSRGRFLRYFNKLGPLILCGVSLLAGHVRQAAAQERDIIVIDAGHGGKDPGAVGRKAHEKTLTLSVALKLGKLITDNLNDVRVLYTRDSDEFIELYQRANVANKNKAALFISIHCNANKNKTLRGAETYIMGLHRSTANLEVAKLENAAILLESDYDKEYEGFDPNSDESYIIFSLFQNANMDLSTQLAAGIQEQMSERVGLNDRGVRQAGFLVLYKTAMPSVLAEIGYLSNPEEEDFLISQKGQDYIASAIYRAIRDYRQKTRTGNASVPGPARTAPDKKPQPKPAVTTGKKEVFYSVQIKSSPTQLKTDPASFKGINGVEMYRHEGLYKYRVGKETNLDRAFGILDEVKKKGYKDAFVIAFQGAERITVIRAKELLGQ